MATAPVPDVLGDLSRAERDTAQALHSLARLPDPDREPDAIQAELELAGRTRAGVNLPNPWEVASWE